MKEYRHGSPDAADAVITSCRLEETPSHDIVHVWNRGGKAGTLTVEKGDGLNVIVKLLDGIAFGG